MDTREIISAEETTILPSQEGLAAKVNSRIEFDNTNDAVKITIFTNGEGESEPFAVMCAIVPFSISAFQLAQEGRGKNGPFSLYTPSGIRIPEGINCSMLKRRAIISKLHKN